MTAKTLHEAGVRHYADAPMPCPCQYGQSGACSAGDHKSCGVAGDTVAGEGFVQTRRGYVAAFPEPYTHPTASATGSRRERWAFVWLADRRCRWVCPCSCHAGLGLGQLDLFDLLVVA